MRRFFLVLVIGLIVVTFVALLGPELPENNIIHSIGQWIRDLVGGIGDAIGFSSRGLSGSLGG